MAFCIDSPDPETTQRVAAILGRCIGARGLVIGLVGPLGAGKTHFVKGLAEGLGLDPRLVSSPTFVIAQQYPLELGDAMLHHVDFYRLESETELEGLGFRDWLVRGQIVVAEWSDRFPEALGKDSLRVVIERAGPEASAVDASDDLALELVDDGRRRISLTAHGDESARVLADLETRWARTRPGRSSAGGSGSDARTDSGLVAVLVAAGLLGWQVAQADRAIPNEDLARLETPDDPFEREIDRLLEGGKLDPNFASQRLLENLPGLGPGRAAAIVAERARAPFGSLRDLERVSGIGPATREQLEPFLAVEGEVEVGGAVDAGGSAG